ncbi:MAG TPA: DUF222 domain-containing protein [Mycobacterium sp.]|nr:DUF222 domain-containing protein [Mycobacterium sp.]
MFEDVSDAAVVSAIGDAARAENVACARRLAAIAELYQRRQIPVEDGHGRELWRMDVWEAVAAEVAAAQGITSAAASALMQVAICLHERLPRVGALFATGALAYRTVALIVNRTLLAIDPEILALIDAELADGLTRWGVLSRNKTEQHIDALIERHDPEARRRTETAARSRYVDITHHNGISWLNGELYSTVPRKREVPPATLLDRRLTALAHTVCDRDPRTVEQRRADALGALAAGHTSMACACGATDCPAADTESPAAVVIHVAVEQSALEEADTTALHGWQPGDDGPEIVSDPERFAEIIREAANPEPTHRPFASTAPPPNPGLISGGPLIPAAILADLVARGAARLRPLIHPGTGPPEPHYRPSAKLADFVRCRDLTCRFPHCDRPAEYCDLDHTIPYGAGGLTHASNLKVLCRFHHLLKTFWTNWHDRQLPDGTVIWTSPSGHTYRTVPGSRLLIPTLSLPTGTLPPPPDRKAHPGRGTRMPTRRYSRATDRHRRIIAERKQNRGSVTTPAGRPAHPVGRGAGSRCPAPAGRFWPA